MSHASIVVSLCFVPLRLTHTFSGAPRGEPLAFRQQAA
jgi:hypothetical protein